jgi:hypothetical protein
MRRSSKKLPTDSNKLAAAIVRLSTEEPDLKADDLPATPQSPIRAYLAEIGRKGGLKGGKARAAKLPAKKRSDIAKKAAKARWASKHK